MPLHAGVRLGPYEIHSAIGAGGMGEVYRARDTKLGRDVAIKIVADGFGHDSERVGRFQREAHILAALNHPHIAAIYGLEEANGAQFLVLELVQGQTLAERLKNGPLRVAEALTVARQIADALQAAHEKGIIHRDLKPANTAFTDDGQVKVLDFGLAKALEPEPVADLANSPTMTLGATHPGVILGTAAYMAPEQAKGRPADKRSDVWAFGCVLYEMLTGKRAFEGEDVSDTLAAVLRGEPNWAALPTDLPPAIRTLVQRCLQKDRTQRIADISTAHFLLSEPASLAPAGASIARAPHMPLWRRAAVPVGAALAAAVVTSAGTWFMMRPPPPRVSRLLVVPSAAAALATTFNTRHVAITPDGTRLVYTGPDSTLFVRAMGQLDGTLLTGVGRPAAPFVSPDGQWIGFDGDNPRGGFDLKKIAITGGPAVTLCKLDAGLRGATWGPDDTIVFATVSVTTGLQQVPAGGGEPTVLTRPDLARGEGDHLWPEFLPGGQAVLFTITSGAGLDQAQVAVLDLRTRTQTTLIRGGSDAHYVPSGHLVYGAEGTLRAVGFDLAQLAVVGTPVPVVSQVVTTNTGAVDVAVAADGTLVYIPGTTAASAQRTLVWVDRTGKEESIALKPRAYNALRFSPDGTRVAMFIGDEENDIWLWDLARASLTQLTFDRLTDYFPVWTPNGRRIVFASQREGNGQHLWWQASDGTGVAERLITSTNDATTPTDISPDGTHLIFYHRTPTASRDLMRLEMLSTAISGPGDAAEPRRVSPLLQTPFDEQSGFVSPDGRWLAYQSNSSGRFEIYVRPFPNTLGGQWRVSNGGGRQPLWARSGEELFFLGADNALMRVGVETKAATWTATTPTKLLDIKRYFNGVETQPARMYDISADDQRFLMIKPSGGSESTPAPTSLVVVQHFDEELKRLVPTER